MEASTSQSMMMRKLGGYGAAIAVTPYLLIKVAWTAGILLPDARMGEPAWRAINATTALLALVGVPLGPAAVATDQAAGAAPARANEQLLVIVSLVGVGLPLAFWGYAKARWPEALGGPRDLEEAPGHTRQLRLPLAGMVAVGCVLLGLTKLYWALGGTIGIDPSRLDDRDLWWRLLTVSTGGWSLAGAWAILVLTARRGARRVSCSGWSWR